MEIIDRETAKSWYDGMISLRVLTSAKIHMKIAELKNKLLFTDPSLVAERNGLKEALGYLVAKRGSK